MKPHLKSKVAEWYLQQQSGGGPSPVYLSLPVTIPAKSGGTLLTSGMGSAISQSELGTGVNMGYVPDTWLNTLRAQSLLTPTKIFRPNRDDGGYAVVDCSALGSIPTGMIGYTGTPANDFLEYYRLILIANTGLSTTHGIRWQGKAGGTTLKCHDIVIRYPQSPGIQCNDASLPYSALEFKYIRIAGQTGLAPGDFVEGIYCGNTNPATIGLIDNLTLEHIFIQDFAGDAVQANCVQNLSISNITAINCGYNILSGHKSALQLQNIGNGATVSNCLFHNIPQAFTVAARDVTFNKCIFYTAEAGFYQDVVTQAGYASPLSSVGGTVTFNECEFYSSEARTNAVEIHENNANFVFNNCKRGSNVTNLYQDSRSSPGVHTITNNGESVGTYEAPTFISVDPVDTLTFGFLTNSVYRNRSIGFGNL
jgi:hypothetical protein